MDENEKLRIWVEHKTNILKKQSGRNAIKWKSAVSMDQNYQKMKDGYLNLKSHVDDGNRVI